MGIEAPNHHDQGHADATSRLIAIDPTTDPRWVSLGDTHRTDVFHSPAWMRVLARTYGFDIRAALVVDKSDRPVGGLGYVDFDDFMDPRLVSLPFSDFCDPLVSRRADFELIFSDLLARQRPIKLRCLRTDQSLLSDRLQTTGELGWHLIDISREPDRIWSEVSSSARRAIRKSRSEGVEVRPATGKRDLRSFFELHLRVRKHKYGLLAQPYRFFEAIWDEFIARDQGVLLLAHRDGELIGGVLYLEWRDTLYYKFNASDPNELQSRPNDALLWAGIEHGSERGLARLDFGVSDLDQEGLMRYKQKYASEEGVVRVLTHTPQGFPTGADRRARSVLSEMTSLFVDPEVPDRVTETAGDHLYRYFT